MGFFEKIEKAIDFLETEKEDNVAVTLIYAELKDIRKHLLLEQYSTDLSAENLRSGMNFRKALKNKGSSE